MNIDNDTTWTEVRISVLTESIARAQDALAFLQLGQRDRISLEITDDMVQVYLDEGKLTYPFDPSEPTEREVWYYSEAYEGAAYDYLGDDEDPLMQEIDNAFSCLSAYAYGAAAAAVEILSITKKEN